MAGGAEVGYLGGLVEAWRPHRGPTKSRTTEQPWDSTYCCTAWEMSNDPVAGAGQLDALPEALLGDPDELQGPPGSPPRRGKVAAQSPWKPVQIGAHVHTDDVALLQLPGAGDAVDDLLVMEMQAEPLKPPLAQERGLRPVALDELAHGGVDFVGGHTGPHQGTGQRPGWAVSRPARRMHSISRGDLREIISISFTSPAVP